MPLPESIAAQVALLDPAAQVVIGLVWQVHEEQMAELRALSERLAERDAQLEVLRAQNEKFRQMIFGRRSEKMPPMSSEVRRVVEADEFPLDMPAGTSATEMAEAQTTARRKRGRKDSEVARERRRKALERLPVVHERVTVTAEQFPEGLTREDFRPLGDGDVVRRIEHVREHLVIIEYQLEKLVERGGERILEASAPPNVVDGGAWGPSVYAQVVVSKCVDSMPLYRQERALGRAGHPVARSVLCGLFHRAANVLEPLYDRLVEQVRHGPYVHADETRLRVAEPGKARNAWIWTLLDDRTVVYVYSETRGAETAQHLLANTRGHLIADGYKGYDSVVGEGGRTRVGCWAHARRKFFEALASSPEARELLDLIVEVYRVEYEAADLEILGGPAHQILRNDKSRPLLATIDAWVDAHRKSTPPKSPLGEALTYAKNQRKALSVFLDDPKVPLDNNAAERALKIVAVGRKNFLFVGHDEAGHNLAVLQTLCSTCQMHGINPYEYIRDVAVRVRTHPQARIDELLPANWKPAESDAAA